MTTDIKTKHPNWGGRRDNQTGRPKKEEARKARGFRCTDAEWQAIMDNAKASGMSAAEFIRFRTIGVKSL